MNLAEIVERIRKYKRKVDADLFPGADEREVQRLAADVKRRHGVTLPHEYLNLLRLTNGLAHDGVEIYASKPMFTDPDDQEYPSIDGLVEANEGLALDESAIPNGLAFGVGDLGDVYGLDIPSGTFNQYDVYRKPLKRFGSFEEMFRHMFESRA